MRGSGQVMKGRIKEAAGALTGSDRLRAGGQRDQAAGHVKLIAERTARNVSTALQKIADTVKGVVRRAID
jgi:uncharacterized protein YjbJ (UPF0337 family)